MTDRKVKQIIPLVGLREVSQGNYILLHSPDAGGDSIPWYPIGAALTEDGHVLPLVWDGHINFRIVDPSELAAVREIRRAVRNL